MTQAYLGLGSNLGDRRALLRTAIAMIGAEGGIEILARSSVYETVPMGGPKDQPLYLNQAIALNTSLEPRALWERCAAIETALGRNRENEERWGARPVDIDLLVYDGNVIQDEDLVVPHPRLAARAFVLVPLAEIAPDLEVPGYGRIGVLLDRLGTLGGIRRLDG